MDKVTRYFETKLLENDPQKGPRECFIMHSWIEAEFGRIVINTIAEIPGLLIVQRVLETSGTYEEDIFMARVGELQYFTSLLPMFNPKNIKDYGLSQTEQEPAQSPQF